MESQLSAQPAESVEPSVSTDQAPLVTRDRAPATRGWLATPAVAILAVVCCTGPLLLGALAATGGGAWLGAHGYIIGAAGLIAMAALLAWRINARTRRQ